MQRTRRLLPSVVLVSALALGACVDPATTDAPGAAPDPAASDAPLTVEDVLAEVAGLGLSSEDRIAWLAERAADEEPVLLYASSDVEVAESWLARFRTEHPDVEAEYVSLEQDDLPLRIQSEEAAGRPLADVVYTSIPGLSLLRAADVLAPHGGATVPDGQPAARVLDEAVIMKVGPQVIAWNTDLLDPAVPPATIDDLLAPEYSGCVLTDTATWTGVFVEAFGRDAVAAWYEAFLANGGVMAKSSGEQLRRLQAGEIGCLVTAQLIDVAGGIAAGAPLAFAAPEPTPATTHAVAVTRSTSSPYAATLLALWLAEPAQTRVLLEVSSGIPAHPDAAGAAPELAVWADPDAPEAARLRTLDLATAAGTSEVAFALLEQYHTPNLVGD